jgi:hypothetical protein
MGCAMATAPTALSLTYSRPFSLGEWVEICATGRYFGLPDPSIPHVVPHQHWLTAYSTKIASCDVAASKV